MSDFNIVKAGWLFRQSSILKRWKKNWFVLYANCDLKYFENQDSHFAEETIVVNHEVVSIAAGRNCHYGDGVSPPYNLSVECMFRLRGRDKYWQLCAETEDDAEAWKLSLEQARVHTQSSSIQQPGSSSEQPPPYHSVVGSEPPGCPPQQGVHSQGAAYPQQHVAYGYPGQVYYGSNPPQYIQQVPGHQTIIYTDQDPYYQRRRYNGNDLAMGMVAGAALGTMMWGPLWW